MDKNQIKFLTDKFLESQGDDPEFYREIVERVIAWTIDTIAIKYKMDI